MRIAIDGPAGAGKSTIAKRIARELGIHYLDTGAMYRAVALQVLNENVDPADPNQVLQVAQNAQLTFRNHQICVRGHSVAEEIRTPEVNRMVSKVAALPALREWMVTRQREIARVSDVVMDGRDIGSVVLPDAEYKFYLDASIEIRAKRRYMEQQMSNTKQSLEEIMEDIQRRDHEDRNRAVGPLTIAEDAVVIDTSSMNPDQVVETILNLIKD